jgi:L-alanine-DL-glutamate epimerase-like enolase superfamily enzyme
VRALAPYDIFWLEEPLPAEDFRGYATLRQAIDIPLAAGESLYTEAQFRELLLAGAIDFIQPNVCRVGGITPFLRIARLARQFSIPVMPHLLPDINGQLAMALPLPAFVEDIDEASFAALGALARPSGVVIAGDTLTADPSPGLGFTFATDTMPPEPR